MHHASPTLTATLRALRGNADMHVVVTALDDQRFACILALAPDVDPVISALGALVGRLPALLTPDAIESPALSAAVASLIGTNTGERILPTWAKVAPAGWGASHADALIDAVHDNRCARWAAAALIGPTENAAALLHEPWEMSAAIAIRRWGQTTPDDPTAWMDALTPTERDRLLDALRTAPDNAARCLPWLPEASAVNIARRLTRWSFPFALYAYVAASPIACARHATVLSPLIQCAGWDDLAALTRLAVAMGIADAWAAIRRILCANPWGAVDIVRAALWDDLHTDVQADILSATQRSSVCAAIAFARGDRGDPPTITSETAGAFFAVVTPKVWTSLSPAERHAWRSRLDREDSYLPARSLGLDPAFLACAVLNTDLIAAVRRHAPNEASLRRTLLPMTVRDLPLIAVPDITGALPAPPDPVAFVQIACEEREMPPALRDWITAHPTPHAYGTAATILRAVQDRDLTARCTALARALAGWSREETDALLAALPDDVPPTLRPDSDALANALAHPDRRTAFRQALDALDALPHAAALPASHALLVLAQAMTPSEQQHAGTELARALRNHGRIFAVIVGMLHDDMRAAILPPLNAPSVESAINDLAAADPLVAHYLSHALHANDSIAAYNALTAASLEETRRIWQSLPETLQHVVLGDLDALAANAAAEGQEATLRQTLQRWGTDDLPPLLALCMLIDDDAERREQGMAILAQQPDRAAALLPLLRDDLCTALESVPAIAFACADLPLCSPAPLPVRRGRR